MIIKKKPAERTSFPITRARTADHDEVRYESRQIDPAQVEGGGAKREDLLPLTTRMAAGERVASKRDPDSTTVSRTAAEEFRRAPVLTTSQSMVSEVLTGQRWERDRRVVGGRGEAERRLREETKKKKKRRWRERRGF
jgi:hypothetical protein